MKFALFFRKINIAQIYNYTTKFVMLYNIIYYNAYKACSLNIL